MPSYYIKPNGDVLVQHTVRKKKDDILADVFAENYNLAHVGVNKLTVGEVLEQFCTHLANATGIALDWTKEFDISNLDEYVPPVPAKKKWGLFSR